MTSDEPAEGVGIASLGLPDECWFIVVDASVLVDRAHRQRARR